MRRHILFGCVLAWLAGCGNNLGAACDGIGGTCIDLKVTGTTDVDLLAVSLVLGGAPPATKFAPPTGTQRTSLPVHLALHVSEPGAGGEARIGVAGSLGGVVVGEGSTLVSVPPGQHVSATVDIGGPGSGDGGLGDGGGDGGGPVLTPISLVQRNKVDLLFMVDNSPSMAPKQAELKARFPDFLQVITQAGTTTPAWYHIGVITSDLGAGQFNLGGGQCHPGGDNGQLQALGAAHDPACAAPLNGLNFIDYNQIANTNNLPPAQDLPTTFGCMASVGDKGCGFEHQLEAVYRALHDAIPANAGFLRSDAILVVVWVTDEDDDCSAPDTTDLFDPAQTATYGALLSYRGTQWGIACNIGGTDQLMPYASSGGPLMGCHGAPNTNGNATGAPPPGEGKCYDVHRYIDFFTKPASMGGVKVDPSAVLLSGIVGPTTDVESIQANPNPQPPGPFTPCAGPVDGKTCAVVLQHSCILASNTQFFGDPAVRINQVLNASGDPTMGSICDASYAPAMQALGQKIVTHLGQPGCLPRPPKNLLAPNCRVVDGSTGAMVPGCGSASPCWQVNQNASCASGWQLVVTPLPSSTTTAACELQ